MSVDCGGGSAVSRSDRVTLKYIISDSFFQDAISYGIENKESFELLESSMTQGIQEISITNDC